MTQVCDYVPDTALMTPIVLVGQGDAEPGGICGGQFEPARLLCPPDEASHWQVEKQLVAPCESSCRPLTPTVRVVGDKNCIACEIDMPKWEENREKL